jgi:RNA polymerase sigma-70 factor (ECF subfamily)
MTEQDFKIKVLSLSGNIFPLAKRLLISDELAQDAIQQSMMKLWENRKQLDQCTNLKAFIFRVIRNVCLDELKKKKPAYFDNPESLKNHPLHQTDQHERDEIVDIVQKIIDSLPDNQREVIQMRDIDGLDYDEIAELIGKDIPYTRVLLSRARKTVKEKIEKIYAYEAKQKY